MGKDGINYAVIFGLGAAGLALWYVLSGRAAKGNAEIADLAALLAAQDPNLSKAEASAQASSQVAQAAVVTAQTAADAAKTQQTAQQAVTSETDNAAAQAAASAAANDAALRAAAAAAAAKAAEDRAAMENSFAQQLSIAEGATATAKGALSTAFGNWAASYQAFLDYQAYVQAHCNDTSQQGAALFEEYGQNGAAMAFRLGDTTLASTGHNDRMSSYIVSPGFKMTLFANDSFGGDVWGPIYGDNADNRGDLTGFNNRASSVRIEPYPNAALYVNGINAKKAEADRIKLEFYSCQSSVNLCIERQQALIDTIRSYQCLSSRLSTSEGSLVALRTYVGSLVVK